VGVGMLILVRVANHHWCLPPIALLLLDLMIIMLFSMLLLMGILQTLVRMEGMLGLLILDLMPPLIILIISIAIILLPLLLIRVILLLFLSLFISKSQAGFLKRILFFRDDLIVIHVCDEGKNLSKDFKCSRNQLLQHMKYFDKYLNPNNSIDDIDISVHCDIFIFEWLIKYINTQPEPLGNFCFLLFYFL
jgi:hypothetical protein